MIIVKIKGGIGNQLFQYTIGTYIEVTFGLIVKYDISWFALNHRRVTHRKLVLNLILNDFNYRIASSKEIAKATRVSLVKCLNKRSELLEYLTLICNKYFNRAYYIEMEDGLPVTQIRTYKYLDGYWQYSRYIDQVRAQVIQQLNKVFIQKLRKDSQYPSPQAQDVCVHVRRGDYVHNTMANNHHGVCDIDYYWQGIEYFKERSTHVRFCFFSDDMDWVKETFGELINAVFIEAEGPFKDITEFFLMAQFNNFIIANSTFSWWAAVLSESNSVVAPAKWFVKSDSSLALNNWKVI